MAKLTNEQKIEIYNKRKMGYPLNMLSTEYNINVHGIEYLVRLIDKNGFDVLRKDRNKFVLYAFEYIWKFVYIRTQRALTVGVSVSKRERDLYILAISFIILVLCIWRSYMKITLLSKPGFSGNMLVRKIEEVAKSQLMDIEVFLNERLQEADVVLLTPQRSEDLKEIKKVVKVPVGVISLKDYGLLDGSSIIKYAKQLIQK